MNSIKINTETVYDIRRYNHLGTAIAKAEELSQNKHNIGKTRYHVLLGDNNQFWVADTRDAKLLSQGGYEVVYKY